MRKILFLIILILHSTIVFGAKTIKYDVANMTCSSCAKIITKYLIKKRNVKKEDIKFNIKNKQVDITFINNKPLTLEDKEYIQNKAGYILREVK